MNAQEAINFACAVGSIVASKNGANPELTLAEVHTMLGMKTGK
jgi:hypothetical protein